MKQITLTGDVDYVMLEKFFEQTARMKVANEEEIRYIISSEGGDCYVALAIYDCIRNLSKLGHKATTVATGGVMSAAAQIILQAGDLRQATQNCSLMLHYGSEASDSPSTVRQNKRITKIMNNILVERTGLKTRTVNSWMKTDTWFSPQEAMLKKIIDEVI
jgi:ATP-dependent protease ClpP protease subunit